MRPVYRTQAWLLTITILFAYSLAITSLESPSLLRRDSPPSLLLQDVPEFLTALKSYAVRLFSLKDRGDETRWPNLDFNWRITLAVILGSVGASLCSAGGVGGGGLFIPIFNLVLEFDAKTSAALSNFMILGGSIANVAWNTQQVHPHLPNKPLIDFDVASLLQPNMLLGISLGVICNVMFPAWFITIEFAVTLSYIAFRSSRNGLKRWQKETHLVKEAKRGCGASADAQERGEEDVCKLTETSSSFNVVTGCILEEGDIPTEEVLKRLSSQNSRHSSSDLLKRKITLPRHSSDGVTMPMLGNRHDSNAPFPVAKLLILILVWLAFFVVQLLRGGKSGKSILNLKACGTGYWLLTALQMPIALGVTAWSVTHLQKQAKKRPPEMQEEWDSMGPKAFTLYPAMALLAGFLGGMLGIGGGMIINPLLIEVGMHPQVTAATSAFMVFFSSSMSVMQFWLLGRIPLEFAFLFASVCLVSSLIGLLVVQHGIVKYGRASIIVFSVSGVMGVSAILTTIFGGLDVWKQYVHGAYMGFHSLC